jgi:hypothetical protein
MLSNAMCMTNIKHMYDKYNERDKGELEAVYIILLLHTEALISVSILYAQQLKH